MSIVLTGGSGTTATRIAKLLEAQNKPFVRTSRTPPVSFSSITAKFDWYDPSTYESPFQTSITPTVTTVYLCAPPGIHYPLPLMKNFIDFAHGKGIKRFVLMGSTSAYAGSEEAECEEYLKKLGVDYCAIKATWFTDNLIKFFTMDIKMNNGFPTATESGKIPFVCADDIAEFAVDALTREKSYNSEKIIVGPELLSMDLAAETLSAVLGRPITHVRITPDALIQRYTSFGVPKEHGDFLTDLDVRTANGSEEKAWNRLTEEKWIGKKTLKQFVEENKAVWAT